MHQLYVSTSVFMEQTEITFRKPNEFQVSPYSAAWISWFHFKKYIILACLNSNTSKWSNCSAYYFILPKWFSNQRDLLSEYKNQKTHRLVNYTNSHVTEVKFQVFILRKVCIFIGFFIFFPSISYNCCGILKFTD